MSKRVLLTNTIESENAGFEQNMAVIYMTPERSENMLARIRQVNELKKVDSNLYAMEFWCGSIEYVVYSKLADVIITIAEEDYGGNEDEESKRILGEAKRIADLIRDGVPLSQNIMPIDDPEGIVEWAMESYDEEADGVDDDTRFDCYTVVIDDDSIQYTALAKHGSGESIRTPHLRDPHLRWMKGEAVQLEEKVEAPTQ